MATPPQTIRTSYPLPVYNYRVTIGSAVYGFSEVSGLSTEYKTIEYRHGMSFAMGAVTVAGRREPVTLTLRRALMPGSGASYLFDWVQSLRYGRPDFRDIRIELTDADGKTAFEWKVRKAVARKLDAPQFDPKSNSVAVERLELTAEELEFETGTTG